MHQAGHHHAGTNQFHHNVHCVGFGDDTKHQEIDNFCTGRYIENTDITSPENHKRRYV